MWQVDTSEHPVPVWTVALRSIQAVTGIRSLIQFFGKPAFKFGQSIRDPKHLLMHQVGFLVFCQETPPVTATNESTVLLPLHAIFELTGELLIFKIGVYRQCPVQHLLVRC